MQTVDFYYGLGSRYSYLAFTQIERIEAAHGCRFALHPISSVELIALHGRSPFDGPPVSGQYAWPYRREDAQEWAALYGVPFREPASRPDDHRLMARACHAAGRQGAVRAYSEAMFRAVFAEGATIDRAVCIALAGGVQVETGRFAADIDSADTDEEVSATAREAFARGAFGVPTFFFGDHMFWGNDRLVLLEHALRGYAG